MTLNQVKMLALEMSLSSFNDEYEIKTNEILKRADKFYDFVTEEEDVEEPLVLQ